MKSHLSKFIVFYLFIMGSFCFGQNNLAIIDSLLIEIVKESTKESFEQNKEDKIIISIDSLDNKIAGYLRLKLGNFFSQNKQQVFRNFPSDSSFEGKVLEIQNFQIKIKYSEPFGKDFLGKNYVKRNIWVLLTAQIYNYTNHKIIYPIESETNFSDEIEFNEIENIEDSPYKFTHGKLADITLWQKMLEPALVVSSVITVLLLLFTQRS